jgi:hypothetical protein
MESRMRVRAASGTLAVLCALVWGASLATAGGLYLAAPLVTLDLTTASARLPVAVEDAFDALLAALTDAGVPPGDLAAAEQEFDTVLTEVQRAAQAAPPWVPLPLLGGGFEIRLPLVVVDGLRVSGGILTDGLVRSLARAVGEEIPQPLADIEFQMGPETARFTADMAFSAWAISTELVKRFDLLVLAFNLGAGVDLMGGRVVPSVHHENVPPQLVAGIEGARTALHLDELSWSAFAVHGVVGFELGPPFLRLYGDLRWTVPLSVGERWWGLRPGPIAAMVGLVIRF